MSSGKPFFRQFLFWLGLALTAVLALLAWHLPPDGREHAGLAQFLGRFHPVLVHLPVGLLVLVPVLELAGAFGRREDLRKAAGFVLGFAACGALASAFDGWLLAWSGAYSGTLVAHHMWCGVGLAALCLIAAGLRPRLAAEPGRWPAFVLVYGPILGATIALMTWTSHQGGQITHGETYLVDYMPGRFRAWLRMPNRAKPAPAAAAPLGEITLYRARIAPIFARSCESCHSAIKVKGAFRLDSYARLMQGGEGGPEIVPWHPAQSELVRRLTLPRDDDDFMPSNHKNFLSPEEIALIEQWIASGASAAQPLKADPPPPAVAQ